MRTLFKFILIFISAIISGIIMVRNFENMVITTCTLFSMFVIQFFLIYLEDIRKGFISWLDKTGREIK